MSIFSVSEGDFSRFTVVAEPKRVFKSSLAKDNPDNIVLRSKFKKFTSRNFQINNTNIRGYLKRINSSLQLNPDSSSFTVRRQTIDDILTESEVARRFGDSSKDFVLPYLDEFFQKKWMIQDILEPYYGGSSWSYPNYHSINFYALSGVGGGALLYPNIGDRYNLDGNQFTIDFRIKINHRVNSVGTIIHFPNNFSLFVRPNTVLDEFGKIKAYDLILKKGTDSNTVPANAETNCVINCLQLNTWHRVTIRQDNTSLKISVSGKDEVINTSSFTYANNSGILVLGSLCSGSDHAPDNHKIFFNKRASLTRGIEEFTGIDDSNQNDEQPGGDSPFFSFTNPLYAEIHDFSIHKGYLSDSVVNASAKTTLFVSGSCIFYLGPYFSLNPVVRRNTYNIGGLFSDPRTGVLRDTKVNPGYTPNRLNGSTTEPFNTWVSFGSGELIINLENFFSDFSRKNQARPRIYWDKDEKFDNLRNLLILPCDDGGFRPSLSFLDSVGVKNIISLKFSFESLNFLTSDFLKTDVKILEAKMKYGASPLNRVLYNERQLPEKVKNYVNSISSDSDEVISLKSLSYPKLLRDITGDNSSNQIVIFDISNLFYGKFIKPGTFIIKDPQLAGSSDDNPIGITIKDDGMGGLYRADSLGEHARWNTVGRIFYNEGLVLIKNPHLFFFGKSGFEVSFSGEQNIHTLKIEVVAPQNSLNLSSNDPNQKLLPSNDPSDKKTGFVYITGLNFHDKNYNVVAKTQLAQPIVKRHEDKIMFRVQMDF